MMVSPLTAFAENDGAGLPTSTGMIVMYLLKRGAAKCARAGGSHRCSFAASDFRLK